MVTHASIPFNQAFDDPNEFNHMLVNSDIAEKCTSTPDHLVQSLRPENPAFVKDFADNLLGSWDEYGDLSCSSAQDDTLTFGNFGRDGNGDSRSLDPWCEILSTECDLSLNLQTYSPSLDLVPEFPTAEWLMPWENTLTNITSSKAVPIAPGNSYQPTPASLSVSCSFRDPTIASVSSFGTDNQRWHATLARSRAADRYFLYGVVTTKIFCRPSCASRRPSRRHVRFFSFPGAIEAAEHANFRPCKRCNPETLGTSNTGVLAICQILRRIIDETFERRSEARKECLKLESLAKSAGLSTFHFHRLFKATTHVTPADFITACHALALQDALCTYSTRGNRPGANAVQLSPRWSERTARKALGGLNPEDYANGAKSTSIQYCRVSAPVGDLEIAYSKDKKSPNVTVHAVVLLQDYSIPISNHFWTIKRSEEHTQRLQQCVNKLEDDCQDRDVELAADVLSVLWRARLWLKLTHDNGLG